MGKPLKIEELSFNYLLINLEANIHKNALTNLRTAWRNSHLIKSINSKAWHAAFSLCLEYLVNFLKSLKPLLTALKNLFL